VGLPLPGVEVELRDVEGDPVDDGDPGRIFVRGANLFSGYWPDGADGPDADGWFGTGDIACQDGAGQLCLVGRSAELVIVNGFNVYPAEVEAVLAAQDGVAEVAVVGVDDAVTGEAVHAYVVPAAGVRLDAGDLLSAAAGSLARFKLPKVLEIVPALPHTVTGKIMKWQIADACP
jgi:long-chain acyl-CoA synthetase